MAGPAGLTTPERAAHPPRIATRTDTLVRANMHVCPAPVHPHMHTGHMYVYARHVYARLMYLCPAQLEPVVAPSVPVMRRLLMLCPAAAPSAAGRSAPRIWWGGVPLRPLLPRRASLLSLTFNT